MHLVLSTLFYLVYMIILFLLQLIREAGYKSCVKSYDWSKVADKTIKVYEKVLYENINSF